jgi:hypothetical protein
MEHTESRTFKNTETHFVAKGGDVQTVDWTVKKGT